MAPKPYQRSDGTTQANVSTWLSTVLAFLQADGWPHETVEDGSAVLTRYRGEHGVYDLTLEVDEDASLVVVHAQLPLDLGDDGPEEALSQLAEFVLRVNAGLAVGSLDLDLDEASVRFRVGLMLDQVPYATALVGNAVYTAVLAQLAAG
jgi:hypothetical protein